MTERYFTPAEVEALIPTLTALVERLRTAHAEVRTLRERLEAERHRLALAGGGMLDQARWRADREQLDASVKHAQAAVTEINALGGVPKGVEEGLVDFPHLRDGRVVNLCWRFGEERITHWHGLDEGYARRKPL